MPVRVPASTFAERLAYARWVRLLTTTGPEESDSDLAQRAGMSQPWVSKWKAEAHPPSGHKGVKGLARALDVSDDWLVGDAGFPPPLPALWHDWLAARRGDPIPLDETRYTAAVVVAVEDVLAERNAAVEARRASGPTGGARAAGGTVGRGRKR